MLVKDCYAGGRHFSRYKAVITCVCAVFIDPLNSAAILKIDKASFNAAAPRVARFQYHLAGRCWITRRLRWYVCSFVLELVAIASGGAILLPVWDWVTSRAVTSVDDVTGGDVTCLQNITNYLQSANQISTTVLNFRFGKTNVRHIGILHPVSISTISP